MYSATMGCHTLHIFIRTILWVLLLNILISLLTFQFASFIFLIFVDYWELYFKISHQNYRSVSIFNCVHIFLYILRLCSYLHSNLNYWNYFYYTWPFLAFKFAVSSINRAKHTFFFLFAINICMSYPSPSFIFNVYKFIIFLLYFEYHLWYIVGFLIHSDFFLLLRTLTTFICIYLYLFHISFYSIISIFMMI